MTPGYRPSPDESECAAFDGRFDGAKKLILSQDHLQETPPSEGGRWPVSVVFQPDPRSEFSWALEQLTIEAVGFAGPQHWRTGRVGSAHFTVRALETYREAVAPTDPAVLRYAAALTRAAAVCEPVGFRVVGLALTPRSLMAAAVPINGQADLFLDTLAEELGADAWLESSIGRRDFWYVNLLHFADAIADPGGLLEWVDARAAIDIGSVTIDSCRLVRYRYDATSDPYMRPETLAERRLISRTPLLT